MHCIACYFIKGQTPYATFYTIIMTESSTELTFTTFCTWLYNNGLTDNSYDPITSSKRLMATGSGTVAYISALSSPDGTTLYLFAEGLSTGVSTYTSVDVAKWNDAVIQII